MTIHEKIKDKKIQYDIYREAAKHQHYYQVKLTNMSILQVKNDYSFIKEE